MSEQAAEKSTVEKIRELPIMSAAISATGGLTLTGAFNGLGMAIFAAPFASAAVAISGAVNAFDTKRSGLSRVFNAAAAVVGAIGLIAPFAIAGPEALGALVISLGAMALGGAFNVASHFLRNKKLPVTIEIKKTPAPPAPTPAA